MSRQEIYNQIDKERKIQDDRWGEDFDLKNSYNDWATYINMYISNGGKMNADFFDQRKAFLKVASLCVAVLEQMNKHGELIPRHYDLKK